MHPPREPQQSPFPESAYSVLSAVEADHWWFSARNRIILWLLGSKAGPFSSFLEVGCGTGFVLHAIREAFPHAELHAQEFHDSGLAVARSRVGSAVFSQQDVTQMSEVDRYDAIGAFDVIEHIDDDNLALSRLYSALKPGGSLLITVPQHQWLWSPVDEAAPHRRRYSRAQLLKKTIQAGFQVNYINSFVSLLVPLMAASRVRMRGSNLASQDEFNVSSPTNTLLRVIMRLEFFLMKLGCSFPVGGSIVMLAKKPRDGGDPSRSPEQSQNH